MLFTNYAIYRLIKKQQTQDNASSAYKCYSLNIIYYHSEIIHIGLLTFATRYCY